MTDEGPSDRARFVTSTIVLWVGAFVATALVIPPDPFTQILYVTPFLLLSPLVAYWLIYHDGEERIQKRFRS